MQSPAVAKNRNIQACIRSSPAVIIGTMAHRLYGRRGEKTHTHTQQKLTSKDAATNKAGLLMTRRGGCREPVCMEISFGSLLIQDYNDV